MFGSRGQIITCWGKHTSDSVSSFQSYRKTYNTKMSDIMQVGDGKNPKSALLHQQMNPQGEASKPLQCSRDCKRCAHIESKEDPEQQNNGRWEKYMIPLWFSVRLFLLNTFIKGRESVKEEPKAVLYQGLSDWEHKQVQQELTRRVLEVQNAQRQRKARNNQNNKLHTVGTPTIHHDFQE